MRYFTFCFYIKSLLLLLLLLLALSLENPVSVLHRGTAPLTPAVLQELSSPMRPVVALLDSVGPEHLCIPLKL